MNRAASQPIIIIADSDIGAAQSVAHYLAQHGFSELRIVHDGASVYETLRPYYRQPEKLGVLIIHEQLPGCHLAELCQTLALTPSIHTIPIVVLDSPPQQLISDRRPPAATPPDGFIQHMRWPLDTDALLTVINLQLAIKRERYLRHRQEELLQSELAERKLVDAKLKYWVSHDELTGLMNRQNFEQHLRIILKRYQQFPQNGVLLYIDIDRFSQINELEDYEVGDRLIVEVVAIIRMLVDKSYCFARIGSDEFCLYLDKKNPDEARELAEKIRKSVEDFRFFVKDAIYNPTVSIGMATICTELAALHPGELIARARLACRVAKQHGRNLVWEYNDGDSGVQERRHDGYWAPLIRKALIEGDFLLFFQPVIDLRNECISHYEVSLRMRSKNEVISPAVFIPVAERMGLIRALDLWVIENAIDYLAALPHFMSRASLAINLSSTAFQDASLLAIVKQKLNMTWINPGRLIFEISETAAIENFEPTRNMILKIKALGCKFALDDFGASFSAFNHLKKLATDYIKIDGRFIQNLPDDEIDQVLVKSIVEIAAKLGKKTIAENIENQKTVGKLLALGVDLAQGYVFGKPEPTLRTTETVILHDFIG